MQTCIIKIGSERVGNLSGDHTETLISDIADLTKQNFRFVLLTSGAVLNGRPNLGWSPDKELTLPEKQLAAAVGNPLLYMNWMHRFARHQIKTAQLLVTHAGLTDEGSQSKSFRDFIHTAWKHNILPIVNENDPATTEEIVALGLGSDNDHNSLLLSRLVRAEILAIMTATNGVYGKDGFRYETMNPDSLTPKRITELTGAGWKTNPGTGGMASKLQVARDAAIEGRKVIIFDGVESTLVDHLMGSGVSQ